MEIQDKEATRTKNLVSRGQIILGLIYEDGEDDAEVRGKFIGWSTQASIFLDGSLGKQHLYTTTFEGNVGREPLEDQMEDQVAAGVAILEAVKEDIEGGYLRTFRQLVAEELWDDLFDQAQQLHDHDYTYAAASIAGAALENGLRELATARGIDLNGREDLNSLSDKLKNGKIISELERKQMSFLIGIRNAADHGEFDKVSSDDVTKLIRDARDFLAKHAT